MTTKVVFVDVDGPLVPIRAYVLPNRLGGTVKTMDPVAVAAVASICVAAGAKIVVSSSWAIWGKEKCLGWFQENGFDLGLVHEDWATPRKLPSGADRSAEIKAWLAAHPEITHFAVIEDGHLDVPNLVRTTTHDGLLLEHQRALSSLLGIKDDRHHPVHGGCHHEWRGRGDGSYECLRCGIPAYPGDPHCPWTFNV